jgi:two-component system, cell cycle sensor histidine kinase and response regulator CckA
MFANHLNNDAFFRHLIENTSDLIYRIGLLPRPHFEYISPSALTLTGYTPEEFYSDPDLGYSIFHPEDRHLIQAVERGEVAITEPLKLRWVRKHGQIVWAELRHFPLEVDGEVVAIEGIARDITEQQRLIETLHQREQELLSLGDSARDLVLHFDTDLRHIYINQAVAELTGIAREEYLGKTNAKLGMPPEQVAFWDEQLQKVITSAAPNIFSFQLTGVDGKLRHFEAHVTPEIDAGQVVSLLLVARDITRRVASEQQLHLQSMALKAAANGIVITNREGVIEWANPAFTDLTGYTLSEAIGKNPGALIRSGRHNASFIAELWETILSGRVWRGEMVNRRKNGELYYEEQTITPVLNEKGEITYFIAIKHDITSRKETEAALRQSQSLYQMLFDNNPHPMWVYDLDTLAFLAVNDAAIAKYGYSREQFLTMTIKDIRPADDVPGLLAHMAQMRPFLQYTGEWRHRLRDGRIIDTEIASHTLSYDGHEAALVVAFDITERKQAEADRRAQTRLLQQILDAVPEGVILLNRAHEITLANPKGVRYMQAVAKLTTGQQLTTLGGRALPDVLQNVAAQNIYAFEQDGCYYELQSQPIYAESLESGWVLLLRDVTRDHEQQTYLHVQERLAAVGQLAAGIAHDFNNVLAIIILYSQLVQQAADLPEKNQKHLQTIVTQANHAAEMIAQILDFGRRSILERAPLNLLPVVKEIVKLLQDTLPETITVELKTDALEYAIMADPTRLQQVLMNMALNARDAMPQGGILRLSLQSMTVSPDQPSPLPDITPGPWLRLTVADTGTGIQPDHLDHIFDPFFTTKAPGKGTGLGLAQVYGIIKQHNGSINVDSRIESGTVFTIYLPLIDNTQEAESLVVEQGIVPGGSETILLVEDSPVMRHSIQETLTNLGYRVIEAENGAVALAYLANGQEPIELVISDLMMPEIGGIELHQRLRQLQPDLKLLLISGYPPEKDHEALQGLGWLPKPFGLRQLATCVRQLLDE